MKKFLWILLGLILATLLLFTAVFFAVKWGWTNVPGVVDEDFIPTSLHAAHPGWTKTEEWQTLAAALAKDQKVIDRVAGETGIPARLIASMIVPEQMRLFFSERQIFKDIFSPLKILGNQTQFSWGVAGLKQETAKQIEARDTTGLLAFSAGTTDVDVARFTRIADGHNHYYSYLYVALYLKEIEDEWQEAGFPINDRPEILATLFNIGFAHSEPKANPQVGGAEIEIGDKKNSFGRLAYEFYYSDELLTEFPR